MSTQGASRCVLVYTAGRAWERWPEATSAPRGLGGWKGRAPKVIRRGRGQREPPPEWELPVGIFPELSLQRSRRLRKLELGGGGGHRPGAEPGGGPHGQGLGPAPRGSSRPPCPCRAGQRRHGLSRDLRAGRRCGISAQGCAKPLGRGCGPSPVRGAGRGPHARTRPFPGGPQATCPPLGPHCPLRRQGRPSLWGP